MYKLHLYDDPYYGLIEIPIENGIYTYGVHTDMNSDVPDKNTKAAYVHPEGTIIAGSAALWMAGGISKYGDVDHFFVCPKDEATKIVESFEESTVNHHTVNVYHRVSSVSWHRPLKMSYVLRLYKAPTEVVHGFDVDCCGILYDAHHLNADGTKGALFCTKRAFHAIMRKVNIFNPERASPSYAGRLIKYMKRGGYQIHLPLLDESRIAADVYKDMCKKIIEYASTNASSQGDHYSIYGDTDGIDIVEMTISAMETLAPVFKEISLDKAGKARMVEYLIDSGQYESGCKNIYALIASCIQQQ
jgi:hypothetical protein